jgi:hypothetical protein
MEVEQRTEQSLSSDFVRGWVSDMPPFPLQVDSQEESSGRVIAFHIVI